MKVITPDDEEIVLGDTESTPTIGITDFSRRVTDDFGVTTVVPRAFARRMSVKISLPSTEASTVQRQLAALRAVPAQWIADEDSAWLNFEGFYKDFSIDVTVGARSFCTLTVEGLAETETVDDEGEDPAPAGSASTLQLLQPVTIAGAALVSTNVPETDWPTWAIGTTYALGARVIKTATHRIYESVVAGNIGNDPAGDSGKWLDIGPVNRWAMFDQALGTATSRAGSIVVTLDAGAATGLALLDVTGATVQVETTGYDETKAVGDGPVTFLDLPGVDAVVTVTISGAGTVSVGALLIGALVKLGITGDEATAGINDFSKKEIDDFGEPTIVERAWAKRMSAKALIATSSIDLVANRIAAVRAKPSLWIADEGTDALTIWGFFKDFSIEVDQTVSTLSLSVEGLSEAMPIVEAFEGLAIVEKTLFKRSATLPDTPTGGSFNFDTLETTPPSGWSVSIPDGPNPAYAIIGIASKEGPGGIADFGPWSAPEKAFADGTDGSPGAPGAPGADAKMIFVASTHQTFRYDTAGSPISQTTTITATRQNTAGTTEWLLRKADGTALTGWLTAAAMVTNGGANSSPNNDTLVIDQTQFAALLAFASTTGLIYEARMSGATSVQDRISIVKVQDGAAGTAGAPGAPGSNGVTYYTWYAYADHPSGLFNFTTGNPGDRTYQGVAYNKTTPTESTDPADYTWSPYVGPPNFGLAAFDGNTIVAGNKLIKVAGGAAWNASIHSTESFKGGASVTFVVDTVSSFMVGLNTDPTTDSSYTSLDFAIYIAGTTLQVYESGGLSYSVFSFVSVGDVFTVTYNGKTVVYSKNGVAFYTNNAPSPNLTLFLDTSFLSPPPVTFGRILSFTAAGTAGDDGATGAPGAPGATGNKTVRVYRRSGTAPSTPTGNVPPSGWSTSIPADDGTAVWASDVETQSNGTTVVGSYTTPVMFQAATPIGGGTTTIIIDSEAGSTASIKKFIVAGGTLQVTSRIRTQVAGGSGTQKLKIEWRVYGGTWATLGSEGTNAYAFGERGVVSKSETFTNSSGADQNYEFRATTSVTGSPAGVDETRSHITA